VNSQELFLDIASGRFLDGSTTIAGSKPIIYSKEKKRIALNLYKISGNTKVAVTPSGDSTFGIRLGSQTLKLADGTSVSTAPIFPARATATITTQPSSRPVAVANIYDDPVVTATLQATVSTFSVTTGTFIMQTAYTAPVTASIVAYIGASTIPAITKSIQVDSIPVTDYFTPGISGIVLELSPVLNSPVTATFLSSIANGSISTIGILSIGNGYPDGSYPLTISGPSPVRATFTSTLSGGSVSTISIVTAGSGYGVDDIAIIFSHGNASANAKTSNGSISSVEITNYGSGYTTAPIVTIATASAITASANAVASAGKIASITIVSSGSGYSTNPSISFFTPLKQVTDLIPSTTNTVNQDGSRKFSWISTPTIGFKVGLTFTSVPTFTSVTLPQNSSVSAFLVNIGGGIWQTSIVSFGYGYTTTPSCVYEDFIGYIPNYETEVKISAYSQKAPIESNIKNYYSGEGTYRSVNLSLVATASSVGLKVKNSSFNPIGLSNTSWNIYLGNLKSGPFIFSSNIPAKINDEEPYKYMIPWEIPARHYLVYNQYREGMEYDFRFSKSMEAGLAAIRVSRQVDLSLPFTGTSAVATSIPFLVGPANFTSKEQPAFDPRHSIFANKTIFAAIVPRDKTSLPTKYAVCRIDIPPINNNYVFVQKNKPLSRSYAPGENYIVKDMSIANYTFDYGGGIFEPKITFLDLGYGYTKAGLAKGYDLVGIFPLKVDPANYIETTTSKNVSIVTSALNGYFIDSEYSQVPTVITGLSRNGIKYYMADGGYGFYQNGVLSADATVITSGVVSASVTNTPANYSDGQYICSVQAPATGITASINLVLESGRARAVIIDSGLGYTSAPIVTAPSPNVQSGQIIGLVVVTQPSGYSLNTKHYLTPSNSSISKADASVGFILSNNGLSTFIDNAGYGYTQDGIATGLDPDLRGANSFISSINITNSPKGYRIGTDYPVKIQASNLPAGNASAVMRRTSAANYAVNIINGGYGFTSVPIVTAPAPDLKTGNIDFVSVSSLGVGYPVGTYRCDVSAPSSGGTIAQVEFVVDSETSQRFNVLNSGDGYLNSATVSVITPVGNVISSLTITCQGSYYNGDNSTFVLLDANGSGTLLSPVVSAGKIVGVSVLSKGYGFGDSPDIVFNTPAVIPATSVPLNTIVKDFNVTAASSNAILSTATQKDILMEVFETDGTNEQVLAQATVSLTKRVLE